MDPPRNVISSKYFICSVDAGRVAVARAAAARCSASVAGLRWQCCFGDVPVSSTGNGVDRRIASEHGANRGEAHGLKQSIQKFSKASEEVEKLTDLNTEDEKTQKIEVKRASVFA